MERTETISTASLIQPKIYCLDIETASNETSMDDRLISSLMAKVKPDGRMKDQDASLAIKQANELSKFGLSPMTGKIIAYGLKVLDNNTNYYNDELLPVIRNSFNVNPDEKTILRLMQEDFKDFSILDRIVTFNGRSFDIPYIQVRSMISNIHILPSWFQDRRYSTHPHIDLRMILTNNDETIKGTLDEWLMTFGIWLDEIIGPDGKKLTGADIQDLLNEGNYDVIQAKNQRDVIGLVELYNRIKGYYI